jgi:hypothetical protein
MYSSPRLEATVSGVNAATDAGKKVGQTAFRFDLLAWEPLVRVVAV